MGTEFLSIKDVDEAKDIISMLFNEIYDVKSEKVDIEECYSRVLFKDLKSELDLPPFDKVLKDGYAIKAENSFGATEESPKKLKNIDSIGAGSNSLKILGNGECIEIATGAPIPQGADSVVMIEYTEKEEDDVYVFKSTTPGQNIAKKGSDIEKGRDMLKKYTKITADKVGVLSANNIKEVEVIKKPIVGVISTGNELLLENETLDENLGKIYDVNTNAIVSAVESCGGIGKSMGISKDEYDYLKELLEKSLKESDIVICSGGTSAGAGDVLRAVLDDLGEVIIHGISVKPGKPTIIGKVDNKLVIGLPGNPTAALIVFYVFISKNIRNLTKIDKEEAKTEKMTLSKRFHSSKGRTQYLLVKTKNNVAEPIIKDSGAITALAEADGYMKVGKNEEIIESGSEVKIYLF